MTQPPAIQIKGQYELSGERLFGPIDVTFKAEKWTCILGRSGVGKSTILRLVLNLPCAGRFDGTVSANDGEVLDGRVSYMAQSDLLLPWLNVVENTVIGNRLRGVDPDTEKAEALLERVGLADHRFKKPSALSGGMRQRAALARTLFEERPVALLDEPFSALDASTRADMQELAAEMLGGKTVVLVTHDPAEATRLGHQIIVLTQNSAKAWKTPATKPVRDPYAPQTIACQASLLEHLRQL